MSQKRNQKEEKEIYLCGLLLLGILLFWLAAERLLDLKLFLPPCIFHSLTGLYCPGCGGTRAVLFLLHGQVGKSFYYNPAVSYAILFAFAYMISHTLKHVTKGRIRGFHYRNGYCYLGVALFVANWVWKNYMLLIQHQMLIP